MCTFQVPVVSVSVPVDPSCKYDNTPSFMEFVGTIQFVGGINKPKLVQCIDRCAEMHYLETFRGVGHAEQHFKRSSRGLLWLSGKKPGPSWRHLVKLRNFLVQRWPSASRIASLPPSP